MAAKLWNYTTQWSSVSTLSTLPRIFLCLSCQNVIRFKSSSSVAVQRLCSGFSRFNLTRLIARDHNVNESRVFSSSSWFSNRGRTRTVRNQTQNTIINNTPKTSLWERLKDSSRKMQDTEVKQNSSEKKTKLEIKSSDAIQTWLDNRKDQNPIWANYRRNHKGQLPPEKTRKKCVRSKAVSGNPCPICQLRIQLGYSLSHLDVTLLEHFVCPHTGVILNPSKTGVCREQQKKLEDAIEKARDCGLMPFTIPGPRDLPKPFKPAGIPPKIKNKM